MPMMKRMGPKHQPAGRLDLRTAVIPPSRNRLSIRGSAVWVGTEASEVKWRLEFLVSIGERCGIQVKYLPARPFPSTAASADPRIGSSIQTNSIPRSNARPQTYRCSVPHRGSVGDVSNKKPPLAPILAIFILALFVNTIAVASVAPDTGLGLCGPDDRFE